MGNHLSALRNKLKTKKKKKGKSSKNAPESQPILAPEGSTYDLQGFRCNDLS